MLRLLVTGFEPFGGERVNPSARAAERLAEDGFSGAVTRAVLLPVVRYRCVELVVEAIERDRPHVVVMLGEAGGRARITPERVALNVEDYRIPDNAGSQPREELIVPDGPAAYGSTLPVVEMVRRMREEGVPAAVSNTAGTFLCNHLSYAVLHHVAARRLEVCAGFVHLPYLPEQAALKDAETPSMDLDLAVRGLRAGILAALRAAPPPRLLAL
ncbi:MAG: pyroglutamyl-peptidase I [Dehalococcoidia bacterium]